MVCGYVKVISGAVAFISLQLTPGAWSESESCWFLGNVWFTGFVLLIDSVGTWTKGYKVDSRSQSTYREPYWDQSCHGDQTIKRSFLGLGWIWTAFRIYLPNKELPNRIAMILVRLITFVFSYTTLLMLFCPLSRQELLRRGYFIEPLLPESVEPRRTDQGQCATNNGKPNSVFVPDDHFWLLAIQILATLSKLVSWLVSQIRPRITNCPAADLGIIEGKAQQTRKSSRTIKFWAAKRFN